MASDQVIIVTGAGRGIGLSIVQQLLASSRVKLVVAVDLHVNSLNALPENYQSRLVVVQGDVSQRSTSEQAVETAIRQGSSLNAMILNAGILSPVGMIADTLVDDWMRLFQINFFALLHSIQNALPALRTSNGKIIMTSSGVSLRPGPAWAAYACAKSAMNYLCGSLQLEEPNVSCLCITPGIVDTGMQKEVRDQHREHMPDSQYNWLNQLHGEGKLLRPEQPATAFVKVALDGVPEEVVGTVVAWDDIVCSSRS